MNRVLQDLRYAARRLRGRPGFSAIAIVSLALGIGANTAIFSLVQALILREPAVRDPARVVEVYAYTHEFKYLPFSIPDYRDFERATSNIFSTSYGVVFSGVPRDRGDHVEMVPVELVTGNYFITLGIAPALGRLFSPADDVARGAHPYVVLSYGYWSSAYGKRASAIGEQMHINGRAFTIVGVAPRKFEGTMRGLPTALYIPLQMINAVQPTGRDQLKMRDNLSTLVRARLAPNVSFAQARTTLHTFVSDLKKTGEVPADFELEATRLSDLVVNPVLDGMIRLAAGVISILVGLVLLIACANLASFLLAQAQDRQREIATRLAIGGARSRIVRQLLTESIALALVSGAAALLIAKLLLALLLHMELPVRVPIGISATLNAGVLLYALLVSLIAGVLFGLAPALQATRPDVVSMLKNDSERRTRSHRFTLRSSLVVGQVAAAVVLLLVTGLFLRSLMARQNVDPGFGQQPTALLHIAFAPRYRGALGRQLMQRLEERVRAIPGVQAVGATDFLPLNPTGVQAGSVQVEGIAPPRDEDAFTVDYTDVDAGFFAAAGIRILRGRNFHDGLDREGGVRAAVINQVMAERYWPKRDPIGLTFRGDERQYTVIGIARNTKVRTLGEEPRPMYFTSLSQTRSNYQTLVVRTAGNADHTLVQVMAATRQTDPDIVMIEATTMARHLAVMLLPTRLAALACAAFAALALCLALIGVYGVVSYSVARRAPEMGIRMALGALPGELVRLLMRDGMLLVLVGASGGVAVAAIGARLLSSLLFGVQPIDPITFSVVPVALVLCGVFAVWIPARRVQRVQPARVLKGG